jgi:AbrB family looped-hinge helix DNA binding protein
MAESKLKMGCCNVEAIVSFDERGQLVIPKDVRKKFGLNAGDKFALISCSTDVDPDGGSCCFTLMKTTQLEDMVKKSLGPMFSEIFK